MNGHAAIARSKRCGAFLTAVVAACAATPALAQTPSYATPAEETIHGTITSITGKHAIVVADDRGFIDSVTLHDGTIVEPSDAPLEIGALVVIRGKADGATFAADEIDADPGDDSYVTDSGSAPPVELGLGAVPPYVLPLGGGAYYYGGNCCLGSGSSSGSGFVYLTKVAGSAASHAKPPPASATTLPRYLPVAPRRAPPAAAVRASSAPVAPARR